MEPNRPADQPSPGSNCLLVDDAEIHRKVIGRLLTQLGYCYHTATNGKEAVEAVQAHPSQYRYILMDISMPVMGGMEASRQIRQFENEKDLEPCSIIAVMPPGLTSEECLADCGVHQVIVKPVRIRNLEAVLGDLGGASPLLGSSRMSGCR